MTRPTYNAARLAIDGATEPGFRGRWSGTNTVDGDDVLGLDGPVDVPAPEWIELEDPAPGVSSRQLPPTKRTTPVIFAYDADDASIEYGDLTWSSQDYAFTVRFEVHIAADMHGLSGADMRDAVIQVLEDIREANRAPAGGVFGSNFQSLRLVTLDREPTSYSNHWVANYDLQFDGFSVI
jgi:hypothetical protein